MIEKIKLEKGKQIENICFPLFNNLPYYKKIDNFNKKYFQKNLQQYAVLNILNFPNNSPKT